MEIRSREDLELLPIGAEMIDVQGYRLRKVADLEYDLWADAEGRWISFDVDEVLGAYSGEQNFLPATLIE